MNQNAYIDVTKLEPRLKHPTIFSAFDTLKEGESLLIHNDHDPKPLYYQMLGERGNCFSWTYLANGPEVWEVEIRKNKLKDSTETLGEIAAKDLRKAEVFKKLGLDFCCGGKRSLEEACLEKGLDVLRVKDELENISKIKTSIPQHDYNSWNASFLSDYIINIHHAYVKNNSPVLKDLSIKVAEHHGNNHSELNIVRDKIDELVCELNTHLKKEEAILFPYIKQMEKEKSENTTSPSGFGGIQNPLMVMERDHEIVGELLKDIRTITGDYALPSDACNSYTLLYKKIEEFENDLHLHIHLENNILFPKAIELERN